MRRLSATKSSRFLFLAILLVLAARTMKAAPVQRCQVLARLPHSTDSYTEGFFFRDGHFYEGTGLKEHSAILVTEPATGHVVARHELPPEYFGEGIVDWGNNLLEWTWQSHVGFLLDRTSLRVVGQFQYTGEGWGMTRTDRELITSDGTPILRFRNPDTFDQTRTLTVKDDGVPVRNLNELEYIPTGGGEIYANVWHSDRIARISPIDGHVIGWLDCAGLLPDNQKKDAESVLNGIAYDAKHKRLYVTGKQWPTIFEIKAGAAY